MPREPLDSQKASQMIDRLIEASVDYERATGAHVAVARREQSEARKALFNALTGGPDA